MRSSNWSEVNCVRWSSGLTTYNYSCASRWKAINGFYGLDGQYRIAYQCEKHLYIDLGGTLYDISPRPALAAGGALAQGGYGDGLYDLGPPDTYDTPRDLGTIIALDKVPDAYSLDNFGSILYAMTSVDGRLLMFNPANGTAGAVVTAAATAAWTGASTTISMPISTGLVTPGMYVYNQTNGTQVGTVLTYIGTTLTLTTGGMGIYECRLDGGFSRHRTRRADSVRH